MLIDNVLMLIENINLLNKLNVKKIVKVIKKNEELQNAIEDTAEEVAEDKVTNLIQTMM